MESVQLNESRPQNACKSMNLPEPHLSHADAFKMSCRCPTYSFRRLPNRFADASRCQILVEINKIITNHGANSFAVNYDLALTVRGGGASVQMCVRCILLTQTGGGAQWPQKAILHKCQKPQPPESWVTGLGPEPGL